MKKQKAKIALQTLAVGLTAFIGIEQAHAQVDYTIGGSYGAPGGNTDLETGWNLTIDNQTETGCLVGDILLAPASGAVINTVCTDISGTVYLGDTYAYVTKTFAASPSSGIDPVWGSDNSAAAIAARGGIDTTTANAAIQNAAYIYAAYSSVLTGSNLSQKAALQIAVWAALYDTGSGVSWATELASGRFNASNTGDTAAINTAIGWLDTLLGTTGNTQHQQYTGNLLEPTPASQNGQIAQEMLLTPVPVPEPTTVLAGAMLLLPFGVSTIRSFRKRSVA